MNILWITNILLPEATAILTGNNDLRSTGGWILGAAESLVTNSIINLSIASVSPLVKELTILKTDRIVYYVLPLGSGNKKYNQEYEQYWVKVKSYATPDIVHIHGSEFTHGLSYIRACGSKNVILSIQGLRSIIKNYYFQGLSTWDIIKNTTLHDIVFGGGIYSNFREYNALSKYEIELIKSVSYIIGRTSWDRANVKAINPNIKYFFCNETLRPEFYEGVKWSSSKCQKHTIFVSQAVNPFKGFHQLLKAMPIVIRNYPDTKIRVAGFDISRGNAKFKNLRISGYGKILSHLIEKYELQNRIIYTGQLNAIQMRNEYLSSNVFVLPSAIENSPNSLGEAQILGVPHIASYVGGISDMMVHNEHNLYRFEEISMLAEIICRVFEQPDSEIDMSDIAKKRHNRETNALQLINIYNSVINDEIL